MGPVCVWTHHARSGDGLSGARRVRMRGGRGWAAPASVRQSQREGAPWTQGATTGKPGGALMDWWVWVIIVLVILIVIAAAVVAMQSRRRSGGVIASGRRSRRRKG